MNIDAYVTEPAGFQSMREIGQAFGVSSHIVGRWLHELGLRESDGEPTRRAFHDGLVAKAPTGRNNGFFYKWNPTKTLAILIEAGHILA